MIHYIIIYRTQIVCNKVCLCGKVHVYFNFSQYYTWIQLFCLFSLVFSFLFFYYSIHLVNFNCLIFFYVKDYCVQTSIKYIRVTTTWVYERKKNEIKYDVGNTHIVCVPLLPTFLLSATNLQLKRYDDDNKT